MSKLVIFSDMDGTFLDHTTYEYNKEAVLLIKSKKIPLIFVSSRIRTEIEVYLKELELDFPFISENGGAIFIPKKFFSFDFSHDYEKDGYYVISYGTEYKKLREGLAKIKEETHFDIHGFGDMTLKELSEDAGISLEKAEIAKQREFTEPYLLKEGDLEKVKKLTKKLGFHYTKGGRYHYIMGDNDKGLAVKKLLKLLEKKYGDTSTVGIGDGENDLPMLEEADVGYLVQNYKGEHSFTHKKIEMIQQIGPLGFLEVMKKVM